jgi:type II secretory ATPase GspE/PulE/Tfp pilus assembly ATPase PilB-like protein
MRLHATERECLFGCACAAVGFRGERDNGAARVIASAPRVIDSLYTADSPHCMPPERPNTPLTAEVSLVLMNGQVHTGFLSRFTPNVADITLALGPGTKEKMRFAAEQVAYVGFHRAAGEPPARPQSRKASLKIHVSGGRTFLVDPVESDAPAAVGFYTRPAEPQSPFREIFFYTHGVNLREINEPLGTLLVQDGRVGAAALESGLVQQKTQARTPIGQILVENDRIDASALEQAASLQRRKGTRIGEVLIEAGLAKPEDIEFALGEQRKRGGKRIGQILVDMKIITEVELAMTLARKFQLPFVDLEKIPVNLEAVLELDRSFIEKHRVLPVASDARSITVAMSDPLAVDSIDQVRILTKKQLSEIVVTKSQLDRYIPVYFDQIDAISRENEMDAILKGLTTGDALTATDAEPLEQALVKESDNAIIKLANQIIIDAYRRGASDIHIEPNGRERTMGVRFRVDGDCSVYQDIPAAYRMPLVARFKIMAQLDVTERRKPQDGKIRFRVGERQIELRVATIPTVNHNEDIVLRILAGSKPLPLEQMGLGARNLAELRRSITKPHGLVLCVGPTGSGKTTTLHSALGAINTFDMKIWTAEDPVEITQPGLRQVQVSPKIGLTFASAMRAFLRADPDVIMVGEMRDPETAATAIEASLTGHLVLSTLHTNSAPETITRLVDMGLDPFSFSDALQAVLAQRLARSLCKQCRTPHLATSAEIEELAHAYGPEQFQKLLARRDELNIQLWHAPGCTACNNSGYKGRLGVHELLVSDDDLRRAIQRKAPVDEIRSLAIASGMTTLMQDGIEKVLDGGTDLKQVLAVCGR